MAEELFKLHLRLSKIKAEMDLFINPEMRKMYESIKFPKQVEPVSADGKIIVVSTGRTLHGQMELLDLLKSLVPPEAILNVAATLQDAMANGGRKIYLPSGIHNMNYMEYLNDNIHLCGVKNVKTGSDQDWPIISSANNDSLLVAIDGPCNIENVQIDCKNVKTGFLIKNGSNIVLKNCTIFGGIEAIRMSGEYPEQHNKFPKLLL